MALQNLLPRCISMNSNLHQLLKEKLFLICKIKQIGVILFWILWGHHLNLLEGGGDQREGQTNVIVDILKKRI